MLLEKPYTLGLLRERKSTWEGRVAFTPSDVKKLIEQGVVVKVEPCTHRCYADAEYEAAGAILTADLTDCDVITAIKPIKKELMLAGKTYMSYSYFYSGDEPEMVQMRNCLEKKITVIDYEMMRDENNIICIGSSINAGIVGMFDAFRVVGEHLLIRKGIPSPFLWTGGPAYMHENLATCKRDLKRVGEIIAQEGLAAAISPFVIGLSGNGTVSMGARELLLECLPCVRIETIEQLQAIVDNPPEDANRKIFLFEFGRKHYMKHIEGAQFDAKGYATDVNKYQNIFADQILPYLSLFAHGSIWNFNSHKLITLEDWKRVQPRLRLVTLADISSYTDGPIENFTEEDNERMGFENPFYLFNPATGEKFWSWREGPLDQDLISYHTVCSFPTGLPKDSTDLFSSKLTPHIISVLKAARDQHSVGYEEAWNKVIPIIRNAISTTFEGKCGPNFQYLIPLI